MTPPLSPEDRAALLRLARAAITAAVNGQPAPAVEPGALSPALCRPAAAFVTVQSAGELRGCIGGLEAHWPLYEDVARHAAQAATQDYRFDSIAPAEVPDLEIEISVLGELTPLAYTTPADLVSRLRPGIDGVTLAFGGRRATFLPQVWERVPEPAHFLGLLCEKMGLPAETWRHAHLEVFTYPVEKIEAPAAQGPAHTDQPDPSGSNL